PSVASPGLVQLALLPRRREVGVVPHVLGDAHHPAVWVGEVLHAVLAHAGGDGAQVLVVPAARPLASGRLPLLARLAGLGHLLLAAGPHRHPDALAGLGAGDVDAVLAHALRPLQALLLAAEARGRAGRGVAARGGHAGVVRAAPGQRQRERPGQAEHPYSHHVSPRSGPEPFRPSGKRWNRGAGFPAVSTSANGEQTSHRPPFPARERRWARTRAV